MLTEFPVFADPIAATATAYGNFDVILSHFRRSFDRSMTPYTRRVL